MITINHPFDQNLKIFFSSENEELKNLQSCIYRCNFQLKNEQKSWTKIVYDNKITISTLLAFSVILRIALNSLLSMSMVAFPFVIVPILYTTYKVSSWQAEASDRLMKTQQVFCNVFYKYEGERLSSEKDKVINNFIRIFTDSLGSFSFLEKKEIVDDIIATYGDDKGLGTLARIVFSQVMKDQNYLDKISVYQTIFHVGSIAVLLIAQNIDQFFTPYSFFISKPFLITSVLFTSGVIGGCAMYNYIKHRNDPEIGKDIFEKNLSHLNDVLDIPQEHRAYV
jgi:hypothetical protein